MKINTQLLAFCVFHSALLGAAAFFVQAPKSISTAIGSSMEGGAPGPGVSEKIASGGPQGTNAPLNPAFAARAGDGIKQAPGAQGADMRRSKNIWDSLSPVIVQGGSLRTWSFTTPSVERVQVLMKTEGRPLNANVELWQGPDNTPQKMAIYIEDGDLRPFSAVIETPRGPNAIAIRNTGHLEFPLSAGVVEADLTDERLSGGRPKIVQGGAVNTYPFAPSVESVRVLLKTDGRPLTARIELLQGPNNNKQVMEIYAEDGMERPFFAVIETPGVGNVVRIVNTATVEFPLTASVEPYQVQADSKDSEYDGPRGWDNGEASFFSLSSR